LQRAGIVLDPTTDRLEGWGWGGGISLRVGQRAGIVPLTGLSTTKPPVQPFAQPP
jgi:hypothetical protein